MHAAARQFFEAVKKVFPDLFVDKTVLDFGSYNVNGSVRDLFQDCRFTGVDMIAGPDVDVIGDCAVVQLECYDIGMSSECFEHNPDWKEAFLNLAEHTKHIGAVLISCAATGRPEHGTKRTNPSESPGTNHAGIDYYRNLDFDDFGFLKSARQNLFGDWELYKNTAACDLYFIGLRPGYYLSKNPHDVIYRFQRIFRELAEANVGHIESTHWGRPQALG